MLTGHLNEWHLTDGRNEGIDTQLFERRISLPCTIRPNFFFISESFKYFLVCPLNTRRYEAIVLGEYNDEKNLLETTVANDQLRYSLF